ncbi:MAG: tetraacyldisaccharide 4'-kinase [Alphaproteobacteria bacterium]
MRGPEFWDHEGGLAPALLAPLSLLYESGTLLRRALTTAQHVEVPVICIGNLVAGGAGKTPVTLALAARLQGAGHAVHILSRGYGGREHGPLRIDPHRHTAREVGDEALLLAARAPTWVARNRALGARAAAAAGAAVVLMDDGHQNPTLHKDLALVVVDAAYGIGNGRVIPAGPLREPAAAGLERADAVVLMGPARREAVERGVRASGKPVLWAQLVPAPEGYRLADQAVVAFAGIGRPAKFFESLRNLGCRVLAAHAFPDHHRYQGDEVMALVEEAAAAGARLVTTEKDYVRLSPEARPMVEVFPVTAEFADRDALDRLIFGVLRHG